MNVSAFWMHDTALKAVMDKNVWMKWIPLQKWIALLKVTAHLEES